MDDNQARQYFIEQAQLAGLNLDESDTDLNLDLDASNFDLNESDTDLDEIDSDLDLDLDLDSDLDLDADSATDSELNLKQRGGYPRGFRLKKDPQGRRKFTVEVTDQIRTLLDLPEDQMYFGQYQNKKVFEAARKAYNDICQHAKKIKRECGPLKIIMIDTYNQTSKKRGDESNPPKISEYYVKRVRYPTAVKYKSKNRPVIYQWKTIVVPQKRGQNLEGSLELKRQRARIAKQKYNNLNKKPSRYPMKSRTGPERPRTAPLRQIPPPDITERPRTAPIQKKLSISSENPEKKSSVVRPSSKPSVSSASVPSSQRPSSTSSVASVSVSPSRQRSASTPSVSPSRQRSASTPSVSPRSQRPASSSIQQSDEVATS